MLIDTSFKTWGVNWHILELKDVIAAKNKIAPQPRDSSMSGVCEGRILTVVTDAVFYPLH